MDDEREAATRTFAGRFQPASFSVIGIEESAKSDMYKHPEAPADGNVQALGHAKLTAPDISGNPGALNLPAVPPFRKGLRRQDFSCKFQSLRNAGTVGRYNVPGLPNGTGATTAVRYGAVHEIGTESGAFEAVDTATTFEVTTFVHSTNSRYATFNLSRCSSVFGASDTVMPASSDIITGIYLGRSA